MPSAPVPRKPPVAMESREPKSIRFTPTEWEQFSVEARMRAGWNRPCSCDSSLSSPSTMSCATRAEKLLSGFRRSGREILRES
jgi:hypothetical protein